MSNFMWPNVHADIRDFHLAFCPEQIAARPQLPNDSIKLLRLKLIREEVVELCEAILRDDLVEIADGAADAIVVILGTLIAYGIYFNPVWNEVHRSNMAKLGPDGKVIKRDDGKVLKPEGWTPPDIKSILQSMGADI